MWQDTPLVRAAVNGGLAVLDGVHRLPVGTLGVLFRLVLERDITLFDGTRLIRHDSYEKLCATCTEEELSRRGVFAIHRSFRIVAIGTPPTAADNWLSNDITALFHFVHCDLTNGTPIAPVLKLIIPASKDDMLERLQTFALECRKLQHDPVVQLHDPISLRQLLRVTRHAAKYPDEVKATLSRVLMLRYVPAGKREVLERIMDNVGLGGRSGAAEQVDRVPISTIDGVLHIGTTQVSIDAPLKPELVPSITFFDIPAHTLILQSLLKDLLLGEHLLLVRHFPFARTTCWIHPFIHELTVSAVSVVCSFIGRESRSGQEQACRQIAYAHEQRKRCVLNRSLLLMRRVILTQPAATHL